MKVTELLEKWEKSEEHRFTAREYTVRLSIQDAAKVAALAEMYPGYSEEEIVMDLLSAALHEIEATLPYVPGPRVAAEDEFGDPIYEDVGPTVTFRTLTRKQLEKLERESPEQ
jgi:hypothetical protein